MNTVITMLGMKCVATKCMHVKNCIMLRESSQYIFNVHFAIQANSKLGHLKMLFVFKLCLGLFTHSLFTSNIILHHAQCFQSVGFPNLIVTMFYYY